jgi:protein translocase SecG subunit
MVLTLFNIVYVLIAIAMAILILLQRGAGAQAGSGFGAGASGTVFGARGASNFLSRSTAILATIFFLLSLTMAWHDPAVVGRSRRHGRFGNAEGPGPGTHRSGQQWRCPGRARCGFCHSGRQSGRACRSCRYHPLARRRTSACQAGRRSGKAGRH